MLALTAIVILGVHVGSSHTPTAVAQAVKDEPRAGVIAFSVNRCSSDTEAADDAVRVTIYKPDGTVAVQHSFTWYDRDANPVHWFASVPAGVYRYSFWGNQGQYCTMRGSVAVLPDSVRPVTGTMWPHITVGFLVPSYIYGLAPLGYTISVLRISDSSRCNSNGSDAPMKFVDQMERDTVGYYARDTSYKHVFGVRVERAPSDARTFRVVVAGAYPPNEGQPPAIRFDITPAMVQAAFHRPASILICQ